MKKLKIIIWFILLWLLENVFLKDLRLFGIAPELFYVFVLSAAMLERKPSYYVTISIAAGFLADISSGGMPGFYLLSFTASGFLVAGLVNLIYKDVFLLALPVTLLFTFASDTLYYWINHNALGGISYWTALCSIILPVMAYNAAAALVIRPLLKRTVYHPKQKKRRKSISGY